MGRKTILWTFQTRNNEKLIRENLSWLRKCNIKRENESILIAAQNHAIRTNYIKGRIHRTLQKVDAYHMVIECIKLA